ncbi:helix-turn-helix domain-containing protein [Streptacidiphilus sp. N1-3]|uniref:Helix-turn-helix domain-containing protein n=1 Tax=Streptacidiphilus alkalitolerans TaxID=3342712 RepID=A0ABV6XBG6_9ACTN
MTSPSAICWHCGQPYTRPKTNGRPSKYCTTTCRSAACRARARGRHTQSAAAAEGPTPRQYDHALGLFAQDLKQLALDVERLAARTVGDDPDLPPLALLEQLNHTQHGLTELMAIAVQQTRLRHPNLSWKAIGDALEVSAPTARERWSSSRTWRMLLKRESRVQAKRRAESVFERRPPRTPGTAPDPTTPSTPQLPTDPTKQLSSAMSHLQRSSAHSIRDLAEITQVSPSYISRVLSGERLPTWRLTEALAQACDCDPANLLPLWEAARGLRPRLLPQSAEAELHAAINGLYLAASRPAPSRLCALYPNTLTTQGITALLDGDTPDWPVVQDVVDALHGRPQEVRPLWEATNAARRNPDALTPLAPGHGLPTAGPA